MPLSATRMFDLAAARDARFDGRFLTGVLTTGIYCLPSCPARKPKRENVRFFASEAEARAAGLRPCRRCRPDEVLAGLDPELELVNALLEHVRRAPHAVPDARGLAAAFGIGITRLNELFRLHRHASPRSFVERSRIERAMADLLHSDARVLDVGLDAGFACSSTFHDVFRRRTRMTPEAYRGLRTSSEFVLEMPVDFRGEDTLGYLGRDPHGASERRVGQRLARAVSLDGDAAVLELEFGADRIRVQVHGVRRVQAAVMAHAHAVAVRSCGLDVDPKPFERRVSRAGHADLIAGRHGLRIPLCPDPFEALIWSIIGQQITTGFAMTLRARLLAAVGEPVMDGLRVHPSPDRLAELAVADLVPLQFSRRKAEYVVDTSRAVASSELPLSRLAAGSAVEAERRLLAVRGLGPWSVNYLLMRGFGLADCVPVGDSGLRAALTQFFSLDVKPDAAAMRIKMAQFAPDRSLATYHLWRSLIRTP